MQIFDEIPPRRRCPRKNTKWPMAAIFLDGPESNGGCTTRPPGEHPSQVSKNSDKWSRRRCDNGKIFMDERMDVQMPHSPNVDLTGGRAKKKNKFAHETSKNMSLYIYSKRNDPWD